MNRKVNMMLKPVDDLNFDRLRIMGDIGFYDIVFGGMLLKDVAYNVEINIKEAETTLTKGGQDVFVCVKKQHS